MIRIRLTQRSFAFIAALFLSASFAAAQDDAEPQSDPAALEAFTKLVKSYRDRPSITITSTVSVQANEGETAAKGEPVKAEFVFGRDRHAVIKLRGFTCYLRNDPTKPDSGTITAVHEGTPDAYYTGTDGGSPYYALLMEFRDLPFPELAIMIGEDSIEDVLLQFHPKAFSGVIPTAVTTIEDKGKPRQQITLKGANEVIRVTVDPATNLIDWIEYKAGSGELVQPGASLTYVHQYEYELHDEPLHASTFTVNLENRNPVDLMAMLMPRPTPLQPGGEGAEDEEHAHHGHALVGKPAPKFVLATADGKAVDLDDFEGRVVVLDFWASWCGPCMNALPLLHEFSKWAAQEQLPVSVLTVNVWELSDDGDTPDARLKSAKETWEKRRFSLSIAMDYTDETAMAYQVRGIPTTIIIRADGVVHTVHVGMGESFVEQLKGDVQAALKALE